MTHHVLADTGLVNVDADSEQFAVNARCTSLRILAAQLPDQVADFLRDCWSAGVPAARLPCPEQPKALAVPCNNGLRLDDRQRWSPVIPRSGQPHPKKIGRRGPISAASRTAARH